MLSCFAPSTRIAKNYGLIRQIVLYGCIGLGSAFLDTSFYVFFTRSLEMGKFIANFLGINIGVSISFIFNSYFNFKKTDNLNKRALLFFLVGYLGLGLSTFLLFIGVNVLNLNDIFVKIASVGLVAVVQFCLNKLITFS